MKAPDNCCMECGMALGDAGEFHPYAFCVWKKAGLDPWLTLRILAGQLDMGDPGEKPPLVIEVHA